jgi:hypothetical protein
MPILPDQLQRIVANRFGPDKKVLSRMRVLLRCRRIMMHQNRLALTSRTRTRIPQKRQGNRTFMAVSPYKLESGRIEANQLL